MQRLEELGLIRNVGADAALGLLKPQTLADPEELRATVTKSGFVEVKVYPAVTYMYTPPIREFLLGHLSAQPIADEIAALSESDRSAIFEDLCTALTPYTDTDGLRLPGVVYIATARVFG